jgi:tape measure domain-containing protein
MPTYEYEVKVPVRLGTEGLPGDSKRVQDEVRRMVEGALSQMARLAGSGGGGAGQGGGTTPAAGGGRGGGQGSLLDAHVKEYRAIERERQRANKAEEAELRRQNAAVEALQKQRSAALLAQWKKDESEAKQAAAEVARAQRSMFEAGPSLLSRAAGVAGGVLAATGILNVTNALVSGGRAWLDYSSKVENSRIALKAMLGSETAATEALGEIQQFAKKTPFAFDELIERYQTMLALGFKQREIIPILNDVGNAVAAAGGGSERLERVVKALSDVRAKGKLQSQEIRQFAENGIPVWQILEKEFHKSTAELQKMVEAGEVGSDVFISAFRKFSQANFGDLMAQQSRTFAGAMNNVRDALLQTSGRAFQPLFDQISRISVRFADELTGADGIPGVISASQNALISAGGSIAGYIVSGFAAQLGRRLRQTIDPREWLGGIKGIGLSIWNFASSIGEGISPTQHNDVEVNTQPLLDAQEARRKRMQALADSEREDSAEFTKKQTKLLEGTLKDASLQLRYYGQNTHVAAAEQKLLAAGITDLNSGLAQQIVQAAAAADELEKMQRERAIALQLALNKVEETYRREEQASEALASAARGAIMQTLELGADVRTGLSEVEKFNASLLESSRQAGMTLDEYKTQFKEQIDFTLGVLSDLDKAKLDNLVNRELAGLKDRLFEVTNETKGGFDAFREYQFWLLKNGGAARFTAEQLKDLRKAFDELEHASREAAARADMESALEGVIGMGREVVRQLRAVKTEAKGFTQGPIDKFIDQLEDVKQFHMAPGALDDFRKFLTTVNLFDEQAVAKKFITYLPPDVGEKAGEIAAAVAHGLANLAEAGKIEERQSGLVAKAQKALQKQVEESQAAVAVAAATAADRYKLAWQDAVNEVVLADDAARVSMIQSQVRLADQTVYHADRANARVLDFLASQRSVTEVIADAKVGVMQGAFDFIDSGLDRFTHKLGVIGDVVRDLISGFVRLALNRAFQSMMLGGSGGGAQPAAGGFSLAPILGGLFGGGGGGGGQAGYLTGGFAGGASPAASLFSGSLFGGGGITAPAAATGSLSNLSPELRHALAQNALDDPKGFWATPGAAGGLFGQAKGALGGLAPLLGLTLGASLGGSSRTGSILGGAGGALGGLLASGLISGGLGGSLLGGTAGSLAGFLGLGGGLLGAATLGVGAAALLVGALVMGRNAQRRKDETTRNTVSNNTGTAIWDLIDRARSLSLSQARQEWAQIEANYRQQTAQIKDGKTRRNAELQWTNDFAPLWNIVATRVSEGEKSKAFQSDFVPTFASGGFVGRVPGVYDRRDDRVIRVSGDETVITPLQRARLGGTAAMARAGIPGYAGGGSVGAGSMQPIQLTAVIRVELSAGETSRAVVESIRSADGREVVAEVTRDHVDRAGMDGLLGDITLGLLKRGYVGG